MIRSSEGGGPVTTWNHTIRLKPGAGGACRYTDEIEIRAGLGTPAVFLFAQVFYRYRQYRWHRFVKRQSDLPLLPPSNWFG